MGGSSEYDLQSCKERCVITSGCRTAQFCAAGNTCNYNNNNCFLYGNQDLNMPQLNSNGLFLSYKYTNDCNSAGSWSPPIYKDIQGTGLGGTWEYDLQACKQRCVNTYDCKAAQYSQVSVYYNTCNAMGHSGCNCYIYDNQNDNKEVTDDIYNFWLYLYTCPGGQTDRLRRLQDSKDNAIVAV